MVDGLSVFTTHRMLTFEAERFVGHLPSEIFIYPPTFRQWNDLYKHLRNDSELAAVYSDCVSVNLFATHDAVDQ